MHGAVAAVAAAAVAAAESSIAVIEQHSGSLAIGSTAATAVDCAVAGPETGLNLV